jgi:hypothetical protein
MITTFITGIISMPLLQLLTLKKTGDAVISNKYSYSSATLRTQVAMTFTSRNTDRKIGIKATVGQVVYHCLRIPMERTRSRPANLLLVTKQWLSLAEK